MGHDILTTAMPPYPHDINRPKKKFNWLKTFKSGLNCVVGHQSSKLVLAKDICTLASSQSVGNSR